MAIKLKLTIKDSLYHAELKESVLARQIASMCPFEADYQRSTECEYYAKLPDNPSVTGDDKTSEVYKNKLYYFAGWNAFSIVFADSNIDPYEIVYLGKFKEDISKQLKNEDSSLHILCELDN